MDQRQSTLRNKDIKRANATSLKENPDVEINLLIRIAQPQRLGGVVVSGVRKS
jgi:hypothetical protein